LPQMNIKTTRFRVSKITKPKNALPKIPNIKKTGVANNAKLSAMFRHWWIYRIYIITIYKEYTINLLIFLLNNNKLNVKV
jgi:hypothetical protein